MFIFVKTHMSDTSNTSPTRKTFMCLVATGDIVSFSGFDLSIMGFYISDMRTDCIIHNEAFYPDSDIKVIKPSRIYCRSTIENALRDTELQQLSIPRPYCFFMKKSNIIDIMKYYCCENEYDNFLSTLSAEVINEYVFVKIDVINEYLNNIGAIDNNETEFLRIHFDNNDYSDDTDSENI